MRKFIQNQYIYFTITLLVWVLQQQVCFAEFTLEDEKKLGKEFYQKLEEHGLILDNPKLSDYITQIGLRISSQASNPLFNYKFFIINNTSINAFATPGGYIYLNTGLIMTVENEAQLAAVIAHEIGHANSRHIASLIEKTQKLNMAALVGLLAGAFLGGGAETSAAISAFSLAGAQSMTLKYLREHEEEADRIGLEYLVKAGYDPLAMVEFLKIMKRNEFLSKTMPSYLQTHPGTEDRMAYIDSLIQTRYARKKGETSKIGNLSRMKTLIPLNASEIEKKYKELKDLEKSDPQNIDLLYALAHIEDLLGFTESSLNHLQKALTLSPDDTDLLKKAGLIYLKTGKTSMAQDFLEKAFARNPNDDESILALAKIYYATGQYQKTLDCYRNLKNKEVIDADIHYVLAMAYGKLGLSGESHFHFGLYFKALHKRESSLFHFQKALEFFPKDSERHRSIQKEMEDLKNPKTNERANG